MDKPLKELFQGLGEATPAQILGHTLQMLWLAVEGIFVFGGILATSIVIIFFFHGIGGHNASPAVPPDVSGTWLFRALVIIAALLGNCFLKDSKSDFIRGSLFEEMQGKKN